MVSFVVRSFQIITQLFFIFSIITTSVTHAETKGLRKRDAYWIPSSVNEIRSSTYPGLSGRLIAQHFELFSTYLKDLVFIRNELVTLGTSDRTSRQYSQTRELKLEEADKRNALIYHALYFGNIGSGYGAPRKSNPGAETQKLIKSSFGSLENFQQMFMLLGGSARGWMTVCLPLEEKQLRFCIADQHNTSTPLLAFPIIVIDLYEHAYLIDFNTVGSMQQYLQLMYSQLDWDVVEDRLIRSLKAVDILRNQNEQTTPAIENSMPIETPETGVIVTPEEKKK